MYIVLSRSLSADLDVVGITNCMAEAPGARSIVNDFPFF